MTIQPADRLSAVPPYLFGEIAAAKRKALAEGKDLIDLGIGDPDRPTPRPIVEFAQKAIEDPEFHRYDESPRGYPPFLEAAAAWFQKRFGVTLDPTTEMALTIGSKEGLAHLNWAILNPGDLALVPDPAYTVYMVSAKMAGADVATMPMGPANGWKPVLADIPTDVAKRAKMMTINYPNNPTGAVADLAYFQDVVAFCREYEIILCQDAAYSEVRYDGFQPPSIFQVEGAKDLAIEMHSLSKTFNMTGWRVGFAAGNADLVGALNKIKSNIDSKHFAAIVAAGAYALSEQADSLDETLALFTRRRDALVDGLNGAGWSIPKPKATFYVWAPVPNGGSSIAWAKRLLEEAGVLVIPGVGYGECGDGWFRMSLTVSGDKNGELLAEAARRIAAVKA
ncbi:MAG TPA: LL-diaminopimelate aminotransferase [Armatimonadota bacterium]|jgi:LL-diaminopimelate aminotransferase